MARSVRRQQGSPLAAVLVLLIVIGTAAMVVRPIPRTPIAADSRVPVFQRGMSYASWPPDFDTADSNESLRLLGLTKTEWVALCVFWYQDNTSSAAIYPDYSSPSDISVAKAISRIHELGMKVMLKPMVDPLDGHWRGEIPPSDSWFQSYGNFINLWAEFSQQHQVELLCIGCEFNSNDNQTADWQIVTERVRQRYAGPITYAANWDNYRNVPWWDALDYVGIDAYFPLTLTDDPTVSELKAGWSPWVSAIASWQVTVNKPVIFTEIGYRSGQGANKAPWDYAASLPVDLQEQFDCYDATFQTFYNESWFYGFYWWNWETYPTAGGSNDSDYTPQNKPVESLISAWYAKLWQRPGPAPMPPIAWLWIAAAITLVMVVTIVYLLKRRKSRSAT